LVATILVKPPPPACDNEFAFQQRYERRWNYFHYMKYVCDDPVSVSTDVIVQNQTIVSNTTILFRVFLPLRNPHFRARKLSPHYDRAQHAMFPQPKPPWQISQDNFYEPIGRTDPTYNRHINPEFSKPTGARKNPNIFR